MGLSLTSIFLTYTSTSIARVFFITAGIHRFKYLKPALAWVLIFIGSKTFIADAMDMEKFPASISLTVTFAIILAGVLVSLYKTRGDKQFSH